jgi:hypothetical protein
VNVRSIVKAAVVAIALPAVAAFGLWAATAAPAATVPTNPGPGGPSVVPNDPDGQGALPTITVAPQNLPSFSGLEGPQQCSSCLAPSDAAGS